MENVENKNYSNPYYGEEIKHKGSFGKAQTSLLTKALLICGGGFAIICGLSVLFEWVFSTKVTKSALINTNILFPIVFGSLLLSMLISMLWMKVLWKGKATGLTILIYSIYISIMSVGFGYLFAYLKVVNNINIMFLVFGVTAGIFFLVALVAKLISIRGMLTFGKIAAVVSGIAGVAALAWLITMLIVGFRRQPGSFMTGDVISYLCLFSVSLSMIAYIIVDVKMIMGASEFNEYTGTMEMAPAYVWYFGFKLLSDIVNVLFLVVIWIIRIARDR